MFKLIKFQLITKKRCNRCRLVKEFLIQQNVAFEEWKLEDREIVDRLLHDPIFLEKFDDLLNFDGVVLPTPAIRIDETGEYYSKELFGFFNLREDFIKKILKL